MVSGTIGSIILLFAGGFSAIEIVKQAFDPDSFLNTIEDSLGGLVQFFISVRDMFEGIIEIFPGPFSTLLKTFLVLMFAVFLWKLVKGGS